MALDLRAFGLQGGGGMSMPTMPGMPNLTVAPGGGGPATSDGQASSSSAFDASGWAINFAGDQAATSTPQTVRNGYEASTGLPVRYTQPLPGRLQTMQAGPASNQTGGLVMSPTILAGAVLLLVVALRRR